MNSFDDAVARHLRSQQQSSDDETARRAAKSRACASAAAEMSRLLAQLADYLNQHSQPRAIEIGPRAKWYKRPTMSPQGHVLSDYRGGYHRSIVMLLPDGQLWKYLSGEPAVVLDLRAEFDLPYTSHTGDVGIGKFLFSADISSGALCASTKTHDGETWRRVDPSEALAEIAANFCTS
ncbi:hypothetical protein IU450_34095 [Nocardia abscessus]|uniref:hypothetical protein n=1 Tax=Nocardia abscessus TaxID=120957 RepID=UPI0018942DD7|nr:hypothetical protein [Nocardia abscessus]MBF6340885.1 hypothetical protein [Nocardia abscessus]